MVRPIVSGRNDGAVDVLDETVWQEVNGSEQMTEPHAGRAPSERVEDVDRILEAMNQAIREALVQHKRLDNPIAVWRDGRVVWIQPEDIPV